MTLLLGIDEAGRGPVIGPMAVGAVLAEDQQREKLEKLGVKDSKQLSENRRNDLEEQIQTSVRDTRVRLVRARQIDRNSLTELSLDTISDLISSLSPDRVLLDALTSESGQKRILRCLEERITGPIPDIHAESGADHLYPIVSAASILAKVRRDREMARLRSRFGDMGSGYPGDPATRAFLEENLCSDHPSRPFIRTRWKTCRDILKDRDTTLFEEQE